MPGFQLLMQPADEVYVYDGSLAGFYQCVYNAVYSRRIPQNIQSIHSMQGSLLPVYVVETDIAKASRVRAAVKEKISSRVLELCENVFLSNAVRKEIDMLLLLQRGFERGAGMIREIADPLIGRLLKAETRLLGEVHLLKGFVRFAEVQGILVAGIHPKNFVLSLLAPHFVDRFPQEKWMICDYTHHIALLYADGHVELTEWQEAAVCEYSEQELLYQRLWQRFYSAISIRERENSKCRMTHMPKRYWRNMPEVHEECAQSLTEGKRMGIEGKMEVELRHWPLPVAVE